MSLDLEKIDAYAVIRLYLMERHRLTAVPSNVGFDDDGKMPSSKPGDNWETLCLLCKGITGVTLEVMHLKLFGSNGTAIEEQEPICNDDGEVIVRMYLPLAQPLNTREIAHHLRKAGHKVTAQEVRGMVAEATDSVATKLKEWTK